MKYIPQRKLNRMRGYDYSLPGYYFITINLHKKYSAIKHLCSIGIEKIIYNKHGFIAKECFEQIPKIYSDVKIDEFIVMPDHIHGIIQIVGKNLYGQGDINSYREDSTLFIQKEAGIALAKATDALLMQKISENQYGLLSKIINGYKNTVTKKIRCELNDSAFTWHRSFHDHIIRNEDELLRIREYIRNNPAEWLQNKKI